MSAGAPSASVPPGTRGSRAGFTDSSSISRGSEIRPVCTSRSNTSDTRGLEADDAERRAVELDLLLVGVMRRVVGGDDVDACRRRCPRASRRDPPPRAAAGSSCTFVSYCIGAVERLVGQREVVRRHLAGHAHAARLALRAPRAATAARSCARCGRAPPVSSASEMSRSTMIDSAAPGMPRRPSADGAEALVRDAVALERRILAVLDDRHVEHAGVLERAPHQQRRRHRPAVVGERDAAGGLQLADLGELLAAASPSTPRRSDRRARGPPPPPSCRMNCGDAGVVVDRLGVRHARDRGEAAGHGRRGARSRPSPCAPGPARAGARACRSARARRASPRGTSNDLGAVGRQDRGRRCAIAAVLDQHVERAVAAVRRIDRRARPSAAAS